MSILLTPDARHAIVILGSGIPLFHEMKRQIDLEFLDCQTLKGGYLVVTYRVKH